ncbi:hypothetical protein ABW21_db0204037 [Orbilia brochopaga]|nr:hypothetical protein ABW21_db0204037 [Drechslerella brochopaga]
MPSGKSQVPMQARTPVTSSTVLQSHVGVVFTILGGVAILIVITATAIYFYLKFRYKKIRQQQEQATELEGQTPETSKFITPLTKVRSQSSTESDPLKNAPSGHPTGASHRYGVAEFGDYDSDGREPMANHSRPFLPGDVVISDGCADAARKIRDTTAELTPPTTPERQRFTAIEHWYTPKPNPEALRRFREAANSEQEMIDAAPVPLRIPSRKQLPSNQTKEPSNTTAREIQESPADETQPEDREVPADEHLEDQRQPQRIASPLENRHRSPKVHKLRKFGELEDRSRITPWKQSRRSRAECSVNVREIISMLTSPSNETVELKPPTSTTMSNDQLSENEDGCYRTSIISAYKEEPEIDEQNMELYLWKPLPKPPVEKVWGAGGVAMI